MEEVPGVQLEQVWPKMSIEDRFAIVRSIAGFQQVWTSVAFTRYGSLYYSKDLEDTPSSQPLYIDAHGGHTKNKNLAIGLSVAREIFDNRRAAINFNRGPWDSLEAYHRAIGQRKIVCINQLSELPKSPITLCGPGTYQPMKEKKVKALHCYLDLIKQTLAEDQTISSAHLWHDDLHVANIFVDSAEPTKVVGLIDWQSAEISPLYFHARQPQIINYQSLCLLYHTLINHQNPRIYAALQFQNTEKYLFLLLARNLLIDGEALYLARIAELEPTWNVFSGKGDSNYPFAFSDKEREELKADAEGAIQGMEAMSSIRESLGDLLPEKGIVKPDNYEKAPDALSQMKDQVISAFVTNAKKRKAWEKASPFGN
ncbi:hypothetical protein GGP41_003882 [Bipolaris sorokiniana]|nr:hypothetical protein GGP41_003882 [Bipolaris sorokiniana]